MIDAALAKIGLDPEGRIAFKVGDAAALPYPDESFDLVAQLNMPPFFDELVRVLRPGGHVIVASSWGARTPFHTRPGLLRWKLLQRGVEPVEVAPVAAAPKSEGTCLRKVRVVYSGYGQPADGCAAH